jgi:RHS repeat-associated protein
VGWIGEPSDDELGLNHLGARYYDPALGLFVSPDPAGLAGGMDPYAYALGNPISLIDLRPEVP